MSKHSIQNDPKVKRLIEENNSMYKPRQIELQKELINLYEQQIVDLTMMSKIELGDDVIAEIQRIKNLLSVENIQQKQL